jgi:ribosomal protein S18 acetylase RimI-like enzyme
LVASKVQYKLVKADIKHISAIMSWLNSAEEMLLWGGPGLIHGLDEKGFADQIRLYSVSSRTLLDHQNNIVGFGQYYERLDRIHFGRVGIAKGERGKGLSHILMSMLINEATQNDNREMSLFVMKDNIPAVRCYEKLGFHVAEYPEAMPGGMTNVDYRVNDRSMG